MSHADKHRPKKSKSLTDRVREFAALRVDEGVKETSGTRFILAELASNPLDPDVVTNANFLEKSFEPDSAFALIQSAYKDTSANFEKWAQHFQSFMSKVILLQNVSLDDFPAAGEFSDLGNIQGEIRRELARGPAVLAQTIEALKMRSRESSDVLTEIKGMGRTGFERKWREREGKWQDSRTRKEKQQLLGDIRDDQARELELGGHSPQEAKEVTREFTPIGENADYDSVLSFLTSDANMINGWITLFEKVKADYERIVMPALGKGQGPRGPN